MADISLFAATYGTGKTPKEQSKAVFMAKAARAAVDDLKKIGTFRRTSGGQLFYCMMKPKPWIVPLIADDIRLQTLISKQFNINAASTDLFKHIVTAMQMECFEHGVIADVYQFCHLDTTNKTGYVSLLDGAFMLKLTGEGDPKMVPNGTDGVFFLDDSTWEPWTFSVEVEEDDQGNIVALHHKEGVAKQYLVNQIEFEESEFLAKEDQRWLFMMWLRCLMIDLTEKPILLMYGQPGSGKTTAMQSVKKVLFGRNADVDKVTKEDDFIAAVTNSPLFVLDNVDDLHREWLGDDLALASTGVTFTKRGLYTNNNPVRFPSRAWPVLTSRTPKFIDNRPDIADRTLVFYVGRIKGGFKDKQLAFGEVLKHRNEILTDLVYQLQDYIWRMREMPAEEGSSFRVAAFGAAVNRYAKIDREEKTAQRVLEVLQQSQNEILVENDPLIMCIAEWFDKSPGKQEFIGTAGEIATVMNSMMGTKLDARGMSRRLQVMWPVLQETFSADKKPGHANTLRYVFKRMQDNLEVKAEVGGSGENGKPPQQSSSNPQVRPNGGAGGSTSLSE